jgi:hypothetical protein
MVLPATQHPEAPMTTPPSSSKISHVIWDAEFHLNTAMEFLQAEIDETAGRKQRVVQSTPTLLLNSLSRIYAELHTLAPRSGLADLGQAWLGVTDLQYNLEYVLLQLQEAAPSTQAIPPIKDAYRCLSLCAESLEDSVNRFFNGDTGEGYTRPAPDVAAAKVEYMLVQYKCFSQLDVLPCLELLERKLEVQAREALASVRSSLADLEAAITQLVEASLFEDVTPAQALQIRSQIKGVQRHLKSLQAANGCAKVMEGTLAQLSEKVKLAEQSYAALIS